MCVSSGLRLRKARVQFFSPPFPCRRDQGEFLLLGTLLSDYGAPASLHPGEILWSRGPQPSVGGLSL